MVENPLTAYDDLFNNLKDKTTAILIGYKFDKDITSYIFNNVNNIAVICPENVKQDIEECGIDPNNIFTENNICGVIKTIHAKAYFLFNDYEVYCQIGSNNLTLSGMSRNIETYCSFKANINKKITFNDLKILKDRNYWKNFTENKIINSLFDVINSILCGENKKDFLSETYLKKNLKEQCFVHTLGRNSLLTAFKNILIEASRGSDTIIRFISPYSTEKSFEYFIDLIYSHLDKSFKFELLTNYLPDFEHFYESSESYFDPEYYLKLKEELLKNYNATINIKFWSKDGIPEFNIPGNFIHSKIIFITFKDIYGVSRYRMILTSGNFSVPAWGLDYERNLEFGIFDDNDKRVQEVWDFFNGFWEVAYNEEDCLKNISVYRRALVENDVLKEIPFRDYIVKNKTSSKIENTSKTGMTKGLLGIKFLKLCAPECEYIKDFLKKEISVKFYENSPIIKDVYVEFLLKNIVNDLIISETLKMRENPSLFSYELPLNNLKINLNEHIIDSIIVRATTNLVCDDIQLDTISWQKLEKENIISFSGNKILLDFLEERYSPNSNNIEIIFYSKDKHQKSNVTLENSNYIAIMPENIPKKEINRILIRQVGHKYELKRIGIYQPELWFSDNAIEFVEIKKEKFYLVDETYEIPVIWVNLTSEFKNFYYTDLTFYYEDKPVDILGYVDKSNKSKTIFGFILDLKDGRQKIDVRLNQHYKDLFKNLKHEINITPDISKHISNLKKPIDEIFKNMQIGIDPIELDDLSEVKIRYSQINKQISVEIQIINEKYLRPKIYIVDEDNSEIVLGNYETGDVILCKLRKQIHDLILFGPIVSNIVKSKLITKIHFELPFNNHKRRFQYLGHLYTPKPMYLFSIKLTLESKISEFENEIENLYVYIDNKNYKFIKIKSINLKNEFYIFFKYRFFDSNSIKKKLKVIIETTELFTNFEFETELNYQKINNCIQIDIDDLLRKIENSEIIEEIPEVNYPLSLKVLKYNNESGLQNELHQKKLTLNKIDEEQYVEGSDNILPVWFY